MTHVLEVGKPYISGRTSWPEGSDFNILDTLELRLFFLGPNPREGADVRSGLVQVGLLVNPHVSPDVIELVYKIGAMGWFDQPYSWHIQRQQGYETLPQELTTPESRYLLNILLIDAATGIMSAMRAVSLPPQFSRLFRELVMEQVSRGWPGDESYNRQVQILQGYYQDSREMLHDCRMVTAAGGSDA